YRDPDRASALAAWISVLAAGQWTDRRGFQRYPHQDRLTLPGGLSRYLPRAAVRDPARAPWPVYPRHGLRMALQERPGACAATWVRDRRRGKRGRADSDGGHREWTCAAT